MKAKRQFVAYYEMTEPRRYFATTRDKVAYLLRDARSRGRVIHKIHHVHGRNYQIGVLCLNERYNYHDAVLTA